MSHAIKEGWLSKWSPGKNTWTQVYCKLLNTRWFQWFDNSTATSPKRSVDVATVSAFLAFGDVINRVPSKPGSITPNMVNRAFGIPHEPNAGTKVSFFIAENEQDAQAWISSIYSVIRVQQGPTAPSAPGYPTNSNPGYPNSNPGYPTSNPVYPTSPPGAFNAPYPQHGDIGMVGFPSMPSASSPYPSAMPAPVYPTQPVVPAQTYPAANPAYPVQQPAMAVQPQIYQSGTGQRPDVGQVIMNPSGQAYKVVVVDGKKRKKKLLKSGAAAGALGGLTGLAAGAILGRAWGGGGYHCGGGHGGWGPSYGYGGWGGGYGGFGGWSSFSSFSSFSWSS